MRPTLEVMFSCDRRDNQRAVWPVFMTRTNLSTRFKRFCAVPSVYQKSLVGLYKC